MKIEDIKLQVYKQYSNASVKSFNYNEVKLKKALKIIYNFHTNNKQIFFVGVPFNIRSSISKFSKTNLHVCIPESTWINGILSNKVSIFKYIQNRIKQNSDNKLNSLILINRKPRLIVLSNLKSEFIAFKEASKLRIPTIVINNNKPLTLNISYAIFTNLDSKNSKLLFNVFYFLLVSILKISPNKRKPKTFSNKRNKDLKIKKERKITW